MTNVVYGLHCDVCKNIVYVSETERTARERIREHLADIKRKWEKAVVIHFNAENHTFEHMKCVLLERCVTNSCFYSARKLLDGLDHNFSVYWSPSSYRTPAVIGRRRIVWCFSTHERIASISLGEGAS